MLPTGVIFNMKSKLRKIPALISVLLKEPYLINLILKSNEAAKNKFQQKYPNIVALPQIEVKDLSGELMQEAIESFMMDGSSLITDLHLLMTLAGRTACNSYLEIGTWRGESVYNVAKLVPDCLTINLPKEEMRLLGFHEQYICQHGVLSVKNKNISHLETNSRTFDFGSLQKKFDLIFIDGDHSYDMVRSDTEKVFKDLIKENSVVVWHDYAYHPQKIRYEVFQAILDGVGKENHRHLYHVKNTMCAVLWRDEIKTSVYDAFEIPEKIYEISLSEKTFSTVLK